MLEDAVAESVPADVRLPPATGQRRGGPEAAALLVTDVKCFPARIADGVVVPGSEAELVCILAPGAGLAAFRDDASEVRVCQHIHPRRRRFLTVRGRNHVFAPVRRESSQPIEEDQVARRRLGRRRDFVAAVSSRADARNGHFRNPATVDLVPQRPPAVGEDGASNRLEQDPVLARYLLAEPQEYAARPIREPGFQARGDQPQDLVLEQLPVTGVIFVPDHQVHRQPFQPPVRVGLHGLAHQLDVGRVSDLQQHDRIIAGYGVAPQAGLPAAVLAEKARVGAQ